MCILSVKLTPCQTPFFSPLRTRGALFALLVCCQRNICTCRSALVAARSALYFTVIRLHLLSGVSRCETADSPYSPFVGLQLLSQHIVIRAFGSSGMLCCVIVQYFYFQCRATSRLPGRLDTDDEGTTIFPKRRIPFTKRLYFQGQTFVENC
jgi:hypothetical protein